VRLASLGVFLHSEAYRSEAEHGFKGNHPPPPFSLSLFLSRLVERVAPLVSSFIITFTSNEHHMEKKQASEGVSENGSVVLFITHFVFFRHGEA
jgi:hypothetical protein